MNEEIVEFLIRNLFYAIIFAFILSWIISFVLNKEVYLEMKKRLRLVLSVIIFIILFFVEIPPQASEAKEMLQEWYPNAKDIAVLTIEKSKTTKNTYDAYVTWLINNQNCRGKLIISQEKRISQEWNYELPEKDIECR